MIRVECPGCGSQLKGSDAAAGKKIKCPKCGGAVQIPAQSAAPDPFLGGDPAPAGAFDDVEPLPRLAPAPAAAPSRETAEPKSKGVKGKTSKKKKSAAGDEDPTVVEWVAVVFCTGIVLIVSIIYMIQGKPKGKKLFLVSLGLIVALNVVSYLIRSSLKPGP